MTTDTIKAIQKQVILARERGDDPAPLLKHLAEVRAKIAMEAELAELDKITEQRQALRDRAEAVKAKVQKQSEAIDAFLKARDDLVSKLQPLIEPMKELDKMAAPSWEREPGECYSGFNDMGQFAGAVRGIPQGFLPADFGCPFLEMVGGKVDAYGKAREAHTYLLAAHGILASLQKGISAIPLKPGEGLMAIDNEAEPVSCIVCLHLKLRQSIIY